VNREPPFISFPSHHPDLRRVAPGAHDALQAAGVGTDPDEGAGRAAADRRLTAAEHLASAAAPGGSRERSCGNDHRFSSRAEVALRHA